MQTPSLTADEYDALPEILTVKQVARMLNISEIQVRKWAGDGKIPATQISRRWRFSKTRLQQFVAEGS